MNEIKSRILLVEDDDTLRFIVRDNLELRGYEVLSAEDGEMALQLFRGNHVDLVLLDVMLPKTDGFQVAQSIRKSDQQTPIIFLTARSMTEDRINGLLLGGDDYISKPFSMEELQLKIKVFLRRSKALPVSEITQKIMKIGRYYFSPDDLTLTYDNEIRNLTLKEAELIGFFAENKNKVLSRSEILEKVWGSNDYFLGRSLDVFISRLRKYFSSDNGIRINNLHGVGFRFSVSGEK
jgi:DNA-binding response OmpR family regulator